MKNGETRAMYEYKAKVLRVVDGDTDVDIDLDLEFGCTENGAYDGYRHNECEQETKWRKYLD